MGDHTRKSHRLRILLRGVVVCTLLLWVGMIYALLKSYRELKVVRYMNAKLERQVNELEQEFALKRDYWQILTKDPEGFRNMVRRRYGFVEESEVVFRFKRSAD